MQRPSRVLVLGAVLALGAGCAKDATSVFVTVDADPSVPPILILRTIVTNVADPSRMDTANRSSSNVGDAADRPGPFVFPFGISLTVDPSFAGAVRITVQGIDWDVAGAVIASGSTGATVLAQQQTQASVTLDPVRGGGVDGGTSDVGASD